VRGLGQTLIVVLTLALAGACTDSSDTSPDQTQSQSDDVQTSASPTATDSVNPQNEGWPPPQVLQPYPNDCLERVNSPRGNRLLAAATFRSAQIATPDGRIVVSLNSQAPIGWSPSGRYLASGPGDIWDRSGKRVASLSGSKDFPQWSWSPTADCFVYRDRKFIRVYPPSGEDTAFMWVGESIRTTFNFSPDGRSIALFKRNRHKYELWVVDLVGGELERVARTGYDGGWSPGGDRIFFQLHSTLMAIEATGGTPVVYDAKWERESEAHHADFFEGCGGRLIAARGSNIYNEADQPLVELERDGKSRRLTHDNFAYWSPSCSPNGERLIATRAGQNKIGSKRAVVLGPRGPQEITPDDGLSDEYVEWGPHQTGIIVIRRRPRSDIGEVWFGTLRSGLSPTGIKVSSYPGYSARDSFDWSASRPPGEMISISGFD
jgi:hypothetical protein